MTNTMKSLTIKQFQGELKKLETLPKDVDEAMDKLVPILHEVVSIKSNIVCDYYPHLNEGEMDKWDELDDALKNTMIYIHCEDKEDVLKTNDLIYETMRNEDVNDIKLLIDRFSECSAQEKWVDASATKIQPINEKMVNLFQKELSSWIEDAIKVYSPILNKDNKQEKER